jgi:ABC-type multidrug transport system fused ATPase/permease subunit
MYTGYMYVSVGQMSVAVSEFMKAQGASRRVFTVIDTGTLNMETGGLRLSDSYKERVVFEDVRFAYPTRPGVEVQHSDRVSGWMKAQKGARSKIRHT